MARGLQKGIGKREAVSSPYGPLRLNASSSPTPTTPDPFITNTPFYFIFGRWPTLSFNLSFIDIKKMQT